MLEIKGSKKKKEKKRKEKEKDIRLRVVTPQLGQLKTPEATKSNYNRGWKSTISQHGTIRRGRHRPRAKCVPEDGIDHLPTSDCQNGEQAITQTVGALVTALQPNSCLGAYFASVQLHTVISSDRPLALSGGSQVLDFFKEAFMRIPHVSSGNHKEVDLENFVVFGSSIWLDRVDMDSDRTLWVAMFNLGDMV
jgi:hypothetical protein